MSWSTTSTRGVVDITQDVRLKLQILQSMPVKDIMQYGVATVSPDESVSRVMNLMTHHRVRHIAVLRGGELAGIVSIGDVVRHRLEDLELETNVLRDVYNAAR